MSYSPSFKFFRFLFSTLLLAFTLAACATVGDDDDVPVWTLDVADAQEKIDKLRTTVYQDQNLIAKLDEAQENLNQAKTYYKISDSFADKSTQLDSAKDDEAYRIQDANVTRATTASVIQRGLASGDINQQTAAEKANHANNVADSQIAMSEHERKKLDVKIKEADALKKERNQTAVGYLSKAQELIEYVELSSTAYHDANGNSDGGGEGDGDGGGDDD